MMNRAILTAFILLSTVAHVYAGKHTPGNYCADRNKKRNHTAAKTTLADAGEGDYDIKYLKFNLNVTDTSTYIEGNVTTRAQVTAASMSYYVFELGPTMNIDSAKINNVLVTSPITISGSVRKIALTSPMTSGTTFTAQIYYHGTPPSGSGFFNGVTHSVSTAGTHMMYTISDPWVALNWWPTKQSVNDRIDSVDMYIKVPSGVTDGSNGVLVGVDATSSPGYSIFHWKTRYSITYYLISMAVAKYSEYRNYWHFTASPDSMLVQNFFIDTTTFNPAYKINFDSVGIIIDYFSSLFGRYPFWQEKYGVCYTDLPGGMEHQTMTTIGVPTTSVIAHEICHQWFGDHVSYKTWGDVWLSEGFATFSEQLFYEHFWSPAKAKSQRQAYLTQTLTKPCGMVYVNDTTTSDSLFDQRTVYAKAQGVVNMLRFAAPDDNMFFDLVKSYQTTYGFGNASTADLKALAEATYGINLDTFFNQWIYGRGFPIYKVSWNQIGTTVYVKLIQTGSCPTATPHFSTKLELQLHSASVDTTVYVYNSLDTQVFSFEWTPTMSTVYLNPSIWTVLRQIGTTTQDHTLKTSSLTPNRIQVMPNPSRNYWRIEQLPEETELMLTDANGRILWQGKSNKGVATVPGERLPSGNYVLKAGGESVQLVHW